MYDERHSDRLSLHYNPLLPENVNSGFTDGEVTAAKMIVKQQLLDRKEHDNMYDGKAVKFRGFIHKFCSTLKDFHFNCHETFQILLAHLSGRAKKLVARHDFEAYPDGYSALNAIWKDMYTTLGQEDHVRREVDDMLERVGVISSRENVDHMRDLLHVVRVIEVNLKDKNGGAAKYEDSQGQKEIYKRLPYPLFVKWRERVRRADGTPPFRELKQFIEEEIDATTALEYVGSGKMSSTVLFVGDAGQTPDVERPNNGKVKAGNEPVRGLESSVFTTNKSVASNSDSNRSQTSLLTGTNREEARDRFRHQPGSKFCARHNSETHDLFECDDFLSGMTPAEKMDFLKTKKLCYKCFRPHSRQFCQFKPRCQE